MSMATGGVTEIGVKDLRASFRGDLILPGDSGYEAARRVYNRMIDRDRDVVRARVSQMRRGVREALRRSRALQSLRKLVP